MIKAVALSHTVPDSGWRRKVFDKWSISFACMGSSRCKALDAHISRCECFTCLCISCCVISYGNDRSSNIVAWFPSQRTEQPNILRSKVVQGCCWGSSSFNPVNLEILFRHCSSDMRQGILQNFFVLVVWEWGFADPSLLYLMKSPFSWLESYELVIDC